MSKLSNAIKTGFAPLLAGAMLLAPSNSVGPEGDIEAPARTRRAADEPAAKIVAGGRDALRAGVPAPSKKITAEREDLGEMLGDMHSRVDAIKEGMAMLSPPKDQSLLGDPSIPDRKAQWERNAAQWDNLSDIAGSADAEFKKNGKLSERTANVLAHELREVNTASLTAGSLSSEAFSKLEKARESIEQVRDIFAAAVSGDQEKAVAKTIEASSKGKGEMGMVADVLTAIGVLEALDKVKNGDAKAIAEMKQGLVEADAELAKLTKATNAIGSKGHGGFSNEFAAKADALSHKVSASKGGAAVDGRG